jgi:hypothetical protein
LLADGLKITDQTADHAFRSCLAAMLEHERGFRLPLGEFAAAAPSCGCKQAAEVVANIHHLAFGRGRKQLSDYVLFVVKCFLYVTQLTTVARDLPRV